MSTVVSMLTNISKTLHITMTYLYQLSCLHGDHKYGKGGQVQISTVFGPLIMLLVGGSSETGIF